MMINYLKKKYGNKTSRNDDEDLDDSILILILNKND